jgi:hypothetical protein
MDEPAPPGASATERGPDAVVPASSPYIKRTGHWALAAVAVTVFGCAWKIGHGAGGLLYILTYVCAAMAGLPLGFALFGARHPAGWIAGGLVGYAATALAIWAPIAAKVPSRMTVVAAWCVVTGAAWLAGGRGRTPCVALPRWRAADSLGLAVILCLTLALTTPPLARVGESETGGDLAYRSYFTADFVWHTAVAAELAKFSMPPRNPYLASQPIHYYWTYFLMPATVSRLGPGPLNDVQLCLKINALLTGLLFMSAVFLAAWAAIGRVLPVTLAVALALVAASAEGSYEMYRLWAHGEPMRALRDINIDAITAWHFQGLRLDGLPRCLWYVPQHSMAYALGLVALTAAASLGSAASTTAVLLCGLALGAATIMNPFVGGTFALAWGIAVAVDALRSPDSAAKILRHALAAIPVVGAVLWCVAARMVDGAGDGLAFGFWGPAAHAPIVVLLLSLGPILIPAVVGIAARAEIPFARIRPALVLVVLSLLLMYLVRLRVDTAWVPFRAGQMLLAAAPAIVARGLAAAWDSKLRSVGIMAIALLFVVGVPTTAIDAYNAQDVEDADAGPGFHWTLMLHPDEEKALAWIRRTTPSTALVQMEPTVRDRDLSPGDWGERWSLIPSFAERRMAAGLPISLMRVPEYSEKSALVKTIYQTTDPYEAWTIAHRLRIAFLYVDGLDRHVYEGAAKFDASPRYFTPAFRSGEVAVYEVK